MQQGLAERAPAFRLFLFRPPRISLWTTANISPLWLVEWPNLFGYELADNKRSALVITGPFYNLHSVSATSIENKFASLTPQTLFFMLSAPIYFLSEISCTRMEFTPPVPTIQKQKVMLSAPMLFIANSTLLF